jgi:hypothetical protein
MRATAYFTVTTHGTMAYSVAQRTFGIGLRMAFGAEKGAILRAVLKHADKPVCYGICGGTNPRVRFLRRATDSMISFRSWRLRIGHVLS